jgi:3-methyladenine DNA glycosylase AlkD
MDSTAKSSRKRASKPPAETDAPSIEERVAAAVEDLKAHATEHTLKGLARFAIDAPSAIGVSMTDMKAIAKRAGRSHELAAALWLEGWYEARMLACLVDDTGQVTAEQMETWAADFDNWAICDTACFCLFDRTPYAWHKVEEWAGRDEEFVKRAAFALLASLTVHDKKAPDKPYLRGLAYIEKAASDDRNFVKKSVNWALRSVGKRSPALHTAAIEVAKRLAASPQPAPRWVGKEALRELVGESVTRRIEAKKAKEA